MFLPLGLVALAIAIAAGGLPPGEGAPWPIARVVVAAIVFGLYSTLLERIGYEPISSMAVGFSVATGLAFLTAGQFSPEPPVLDGAALWPVLVNGVLVNGVSYVCWHRALRAAPIQFVAPWVALTPLIAVAVGSDSTAFQLEHGLAMCLMTAAAFAAAESATNTVPDMRVEPVPRPGDLAEQSR
jgi:drug/metabolite transporter (DMT)-like permease